MNLDRIYTSKFGTSQDVKSLGWGSEHSQNVRFKILMEINGYTEGDSVLDVGCGHGDLSKFIKNYTGLEIRKEAIDVAKVKYPETKFIHGIIKDVHDQYDWVFGSGIFCFKKDWHDHLDVTVKKMFDLSTKGIAFNLLSANTPKKKDPDMKYVKIPDIVSFVTKFTMKFQIRHDYLPNDMTIYMYK